MNPSPHLTTRRGFVAALGFGGTSLYGLWTAYGAAPGPFALFGPGGTPDDRPEDAGGGHGGHAAAASGPDVDAFRREVADFIARFGQPDGSVHPKPDGMAAMGQMMPDISPAPAAGGPALDHSQHDGHAANPAAMAPDDPGGPVAVPMLAERWFYEPAHLRLDVGASYRFRLMAADIPHGASIQFGRGARMIRLRPGNVTEVDLTFTRPGSYLVYCTAYCGTGHDAMQARIDVA